MYTLIGYLPNGDSYSMGCHMGSSSSELVLFYSNDLDAILKECMKLHKIDYTDENYAAFEITVLKDGCDIEGTDEGDMFKSERDRLYREERSKWDREAEDEKALKQLQARNKQRESDLRELARIQERLGVTQ